MADPAQSAAPMTSNSKKLLFGVPTAPASTLAMEANPGMNLATISDGGNAQQGERGIAAGIEQRARNDQDGVGRHGRTCLLDKHVEEHNNKAVFLNELQYGLHHGVLR